MTAARNPWFISAAAGAAAVLLVLSLFRAPAGRALTPAIVEGPALAKLELARHENTLLVEEVSLRDPTPLFLPTQWNATEDALAMNAPREPGESFQEYAPHFVFPENELKLEFRSKVEVPARPADVFAISRADYALSSLSQIDVPVASLPPRTGFIEVVSTDTGEIVVQQAFRDVQPPQPGTWQPMEFLLAVDAAGLVRPPAMTESSRVPQVDSFFKDYLTNVLRIGERLTPGFYRISIGP